MLRLRTLGGLTLENGASPPTGAALQRTPLALLAVIAVAGERGISRDRLLALFWPESDAERARGSLKQVLYALRRDLGDPEIVLGPDDLRLNSSVIRSDVGDFEAALRAGELERAADLYTGGFLDGIHLGNGEFSRWRDEEAERLATRYRGAVALLARTADDRGDHVGAVRWYRILAAAEPLSTSVTLSLMMALVQTGDRTAALDYARTYEHLVRIELETSPDSAVLQLAAQLRREVGPQPDHTSGQPADRIAPPLAVIAPPPRAGGRSRFLIAAVAALLLGAGLGGIALANARRPLDSNMVQMALGPRATATDSLLVSQLAEILLNNDRSLTVVQGNSGRARYIAAPSARVEGDSVRFTIALTDVSTRKRLTLIEPATAGRDAPNVGVRTLGERIGVALAAQRNELFASWADAASMPTNWAGYRELEAGIRSWGATVTSDDALPHFDAAAALDRNSATPLVWKALVLTKQSRTIRSDSVLAGLALSKRRLGAWDQVLVDILRAWNVGDVAKGHAVGRRLLAVVPNSEWGILVAYDASTLGRQREALEIMSRVSAKSAWSRWWGEIVRIQALHLSGDYPGELALAHEGLKADPDSRWHRQIAVRALAGLGRFAEVEQMCISSIPLGQSRPGGQTEFQPCGQAMVELWGHGNRAAARGLAMKFYSAVIAVDTASPERKAHDGAWLFQSVGDWQGAAGALASVPESQPAGAEYLEYLLLNQAADGDRIGVAGTRKRLAALRPAGDAGQPGDRAMFDAGIAALLGDKELGVNLIAKAFRDGFRVRTSLHWNAAFQQLHGYPPFEALVHPVDASQYSGRFAVDPAGVTLRPISAVP